MVDIRARGMATRAENLANAAQEDVDSLGAAVQGMTVAAGNTQIGVFSITASGTNTLTGSFTDLTLFTGLKISLKIANANTGAVTFNLNSLGAKAIVRVDSVGTKAALTANDLTPSKLAIIEYDGTDFVWVNSVDGNASYTSASTAQSNVISFPSTAIKGQFDCELRGFTAVNLLGSAGDCESLTGWVALNNSTHSLDSSNKVFGASSVKSVHNTDNNAGEYRVVTPIISTSKYYTFSAYVKTDGTASSGVKLYLFDNVYSTIVASSAFYKGTSWQRLCIKIQPSDFSGKDTSVIRIAMRSTDTNQTAISYFDGVMLNEISSDEYTNLSTDQLMAKYNFINTYKSVDSQRIKCTGKNLFNYERVLNDSVTTLTIGQDKITAAKTTNGSYSKVIARIPVKPNTQYTFSRTINKIIAGADSSNGMINIYPTDTAVDSYASLSSSSSSVTFTTSSTNDKLDKNMYIYVMFFVTRATSEQATIEFSNIQLEEGSSATTYEAYKETTSYSPVMLRAVSDTVYDTFDPNSGLYTKNISDWVTLDGNSWSGNVSSTDYVGFKNLYIDNVAPLSALSSDKIRVYKQNGELMSAVYDSRVVNNSFMSSLTVGRVNLFISDLETGFNDDWVSATTFTGMTWVNLIKAYFNGWKLTTADLNVANCVWTGIASGTTQSGSGGYTTVTTTIDTGFTPYRMLYQLATPTKTYYPSGTLLEEPRGNFVVEPAIQDVSVYQNSKITIANTSYPCKTLLYVNKINPQTGELTRVFPKDCTIASDGLTFTITGAANGEYYDYGYNYETSLSTIPVSAYTYPTNMKAQINSNTNMIVELDKTVKELVSKNDSDNVPFTTYTPTLTWTTGTPASVTTVANYRVVNKICHFNVNISSADGNGATALTVTLPFSRISNGSAIIANAQQKVNTTWNNPLAYIADGDNKVQFRSFSTCTDNVACEININGWYQIA